MKNKEPFTTYLFTLLVISLPLFLHSTVRRTRASMKWLKEFQSLLPLDLGWLLNLFVLSFCKQGMNEEVGKEVYIDTRYL